MPIRCPMPQAGGWHAGLRALNGGLPAIYLEGQFGPKLRVMSVSDIRLLKEMETALRESEQRFRDYAEMASDWFWATGPEHEFTYFSEQVGAFGGDEETPIGKRRWDIAADFASEPEKWREHMATLDRHEPFRDFVYSSRRADGSLDFVSISGQPVFDAGGRFAGYRGVARDITKRTRAEAGLRRSEAYLAEAQRLSRTGSWAYNRATREITYPDRQAYRLIGLRSGSGYPVRRSISPAHSSGGSNQGQRATREPTPGRSEQ